MICTRKAYSCLLSSRLALSVYLQLNAHGFKVWKGYGTVCRHREGCLMESTITNENEQRGKRDWHSSHPQPGLTKGQVLKNGEWSTTKPRPEYSTKKERKENRKKRRRRIKKKPLTLNFIVRIFHFKANVQSKLVWLYVSCFQVVYFNFFWHIMT